MSVTLLFMTVGLLELLAGFFKSFGALESVNLTFAGFGLMLCSGCLVELDAWEAKRATGRRIMKEIEVQTQMFQM